MRRLIAGLTREETPSSYDRLNRSLLGLWTAAEEIAEQQTIVRAFRLPSSDKAHGRTIDVHEYKVDNRDLSGIAPDA